MNNQKQLCRGDKVYWSGGCNEAGICVLTDLGKRPNHWKLILIQDGNQITLGFTQPPTIDQINKDLGSGTVKKIEITKIEQNSETDNEKEKKKTVLNLGQIWARLIMHHDAVYNQRGGCIMEGQ